MSVEHAPDSRYEANAALDTLVQSLSDAGCDLQELQPDIDALRASIRENDAQNSNRALDSLKARLAATDVDMNDLSGALTLVRQAL